MARERVQGERSSPKGSAQEETSGAPPGTRTPEEAERTKKVIAEADELLKEIDAILEESVEAGLLAYRQQGGQ